MRCVNPEWWPLPLTVGVYLTNTRDGLTYLGEYDHRMLIGERGDARLPSLAFEQARPLAPDATWWPICLWPGEAPVSAQEAVLFTPLLARGDGRVIGFVTREA